ncbi:hypothetical protein [Actinomadura opuntiae]|uniref:hypothetical protein n=1 Tax=Actinomadura sp. OS1-43 TaxID=604315 RepID=UPI00255A785F|nr:hypothetical protein [Actinomadura sp. OS1-43]MDL4818967.1 hypothetical protein [Actinomadura sp. OS1-43]
MTSTPQRHGTDVPGTRTPSALDELRAAYREQLNQLAAERDEARRQARRAKAQAAVARADLASLKSQVQVLLSAAARHLPDLPAVEPAARPAEVEAASGAPLALPAAESANAVRPAEAEHAPAVPSVPDETGVDRAAREVERAGGEAPGHRETRKSRRSGRRRVRTG